LLFFAVFPLPTFVTVSPHLFYGRVRAFEHVVDCFVSWCAPWTLVDACDMVPHMAYRESHPCIILQVCIRLVLERLRRTELMDAQLTVLIVSVDHDYLFIIYVVNAGVWCGASYIVFL
jgi:hypothetical protein